MPSINIDVITKLRLNICDPYVIRYPSPCFDTNSSPIITPIRDRLIFIFRVFTILFVFPLIISFINIWSLFAPNDFINIILDLSVVIKALYIPIMVVNIDINNAMNIIEFVFAPIQMIISGPSDIFGSEFRTVKYGSSIFDRVLLLQSRHAVNRPIMLAREKLIIVSCTVTHMWFNKLLLLYKSIVVFITLVGYDVKNEFIIPNLAVISQINKKFVIIAILKNVIICFFFFMLFKYLLCSSLYMMIKFFPY